MEERMIPDYYNRPIACPVCEAGDLRAINPFMARCTACEYILAYGFFNALRQIRALPEASGKHACDCDHPEMRLLPDGVFRCPACGAEVTPQGEP